MSTKKTQNLENSPQNDSPKDGIFLPALEDKFLASLIAAGPHSLGNPSLSVHSSDRDGARASSKALHLTLLHKYL